MHGTVERTDAQVVRDVLDGDKDAYRLLVRRYGDALYGHALRMVGDGDEAAELVQKAFVKGYRKLASCRDRDRVGAWLFRILANMAKDHVRNPRRRDVAVDRVPQMPAPGSDPLEAAARSEIRLRLQTAMGQLTPEQRQAFVLKHVEGRPYEEIAAVMDLPVAALKMRVHRARRTLRSLLEDLR